MGQQSAPLSAESPLIPANQSLPEITIRALILGVILTIILAAANAYLGLKVGQTISASIPAAIISMSILRFFKSSNVLENTMVQTMASVGEALIAGVTYILPALIILHAWDSFHYWQTVIISLLGGILGVLFTIPLRRALLIDNTLRYPEGVAISNVFKASVSKEKTDMRFLTLGGIAGALISLCQTGFQFLTDSVQLWFKTQTTVFGFGIGLSPALIGAGYIIGINVALCMLVGVVIGWVIGIPVLTFHYGFAATDTAQDIAMAVWHQHIRYLGVGAMLVAGLWTLIKLIKPIAHSLTASFKALRETKINKSLSIRTEKDVPIHYVFWSVVLLLIPLALLIYLSVIPAHSGLSHSFRIVLAGFSGIYVLIAGFIFCSIAAYFAGLIGSTNTPVSALMIGALLSLCLLLVVLFKLSGGVEGHEIIAVILGIGTTVIMGAGIAIANDTMQDLKVGQLVGATPWKQQVMLIAGVVVAALVIPPVLNLLYNAYGIGGAFPRPGMDKAQMLAAPQAGLMAAVAAGVYAHNLEWTTIGIGAIVAFLLICLEKPLLNRGIRISVLSVGVGIYLPLDATIPLIIGGILSYLVERTLHKKHGPHNKKTTAAQHRGLILCCGIVAGSCVLSVILAIPFALKQSSDALSLMPANLMNVAQILGVIVTLLLCAWIYRMTVTKKVGS